MKQHDKWAVKQYRQVWLWLVLWVAFLPYVQAEGIITTVAGNIDICASCGADKSTLFSGDGGPAINAQLNQPMDVAIDNNGNLYIADWGNSRIGKVTFGIAVSPSLISGFSLGNVVISNVQLLPAPPTVLSVGERVDISFNYSIVSPSVCTYIWVDPYSNGQRIPSGTEPSYCNTSSGKGSGFFEPMEGSEGAIVDSLRFTMRDGEGDEYYYSLPINYTYTIEWVIETNQSPVTDCNAVTEIPVSECQSLMELYNSTNGANWKNHTGWNQTNTPCSWFGVTCGAGHVTKIDLSDDGNTSDNVHGNGLKGQIPNLDLPNLIELTLWSNQLNGNIPNFSRLSNLESLDLGQNQLTGSIPNFSHLPKLGMLYLDSNQLSGSIPNFSSLPKLESLDLGNNAICKDNHVNYSAWQIKATSSDEVTWQEQLDGFPNCSIPDQFCTSGNANVNNVNLSCVNGNCTSVGIKITCNSESCQWCDGSDNCGNILYNDVTQIPGGTISCTNGRCNYSVQSGGSSSSGNFSCKSNGTTTQTAVKVESVNPTVSQSLYQTGDTIKITIPPTAPTGQSQYFGVGLPDDLGLFMAGNLNEFQFFDAANLPEWRGGETAVNIPVTQDLPRGSYDAYLLRSLRGIDPLAASADEAALGVSRFIIMDKIQVTQITDPNTELGFVATTGKETIGVLGKKDKEGRLIDINRIYFGSQTDTSQNLSITLNDDYLPKTMEFSDGSQIEFSNYTDTGATATYRSASGNIINELDIPLQIDDLYVAAEAIKQFQNSPQPTLNNPVPSVMGSISSPTDSNCLEVMTAVYRGVNALFSGLFQLASVASCAVASAEAFFTGGLAIPLAVWACGSTVLSITDKIAEVATGDKSPFKQLNQANNLVQGVSSCTVMRDVGSCAQFVASEVIDGALDYLKPENVCKDSNNGSCVSSTTFNQWCRDNGGDDVIVFPWNNHGKCYLLNTGAMGTKEEMLGQCLAFSGYGEDVGFNRITCEVTVCR